MKQHLTVPVIIFTLCQTITAMVQDAEKPIRLPLRVHLVTDLEMVREFNRPAADPIRTVMGTTIKPEDMRAMMKQVNEIWTSARIHWETDPARGGGDCMKKVFPALADPARNESLLADGTFGKAGATMYHLYLFPYVGQTIQGTARCPGTFTVVGAFSDKSPSKKGLPKRRPYTVPAKSGAALAAEDFPADGALSATMAHELGHNLSLTHSTEGMTDNLMKGHVKLRLSERQILQARKQALKGPRLR